MFHAFFEHLWNDMLAISDDRARSPLSKLIQVDPSQLQVHPVQSSQGTSGWLPDRSCELGWKETVFHVSKCKGHGTSECATLVF